MKGWDGKPLSPKLVEEMHRLSAMPDDTIDFSDIPEVTDFSGFKRRNDGASVGGATALPLAVGQTVFLPEPVARIYQAVDELEKLYKGRKFTPDGHLVGSLGEVIAAESLGLELLPVGTAVHDAKDLKTGELVQIKLTAGSSIAMYSKPQRLLVFSVVSPSEAKVVYYGPGAPAWNEASKPGKNGQSRISLKKLKALAT